MMTLTQAIESGKEFTRQLYLDAGDYDYYSAEAFISSISVEDVTANDYVLMSDELTLETLSDIWNRNKSETTPSAESSKFFSKMVTELKAKGLMKVG